MVVGEPKRSIMEGIENTGDVRLHDHRLRLKQRFDIIRKLGQGTYGKVQLGINKKTGQEVAIKTIKKCKIETEADLVRIRREVQIMSSVRHPNIVHIYEVFENSEKMILVMEYCAGGELYDYLSQQKVLQEDEARRLFRQIATAVYYCHKHKICHRDLKLENVLLDEHGSAKIADFGLSNVFEERRLLSTFCGSPLYASPEIVKGTPYIGPEVDCWSLGVLLYTLVYGAMPFDGSNFKRLVKQISTGDYFEPKNPSSASPLIRDMLTVDPAQRADITHICDDPWVNKGSEVSCLELAEALANETPVRLDLLLSLAPPPIHGSDKLVVTDEITSAGPDGSPARSMSVANVDNSAERRILEMVAEGGTDAIKPSPTRTIVSAEQQPKRKLETTVSMDSAPSQRKKERTIRSSSISQNANSLNDTAPSPSNESAEAVEIQRDASMKNEKESEVNAAANEPTSQNVPKRELSQPKELSKLESPPLKTNMSQLTMEIPKEVSPVASAAPTEQNKSSPVAVHANKESKTDIKSKDPQLKEKSISSTKPVITIKKKIVPNSVKKDDKPKSTAIKEKSPPRKSIEKDIAGRVLIPDKKPEPAKVEEAAAQNDVSTVKPTERRRSRILDAAEKLNSLSIQPNQPTNDNASSPPPAKPKKVIIPGVSVGSFKEQFERRASLTSGSIPVSTNEVKKPATKTVQSPTTPTVAANKMLANKKIHSVDSEHPDSIVPNNVNKESPNVRLQHIGVEPIAQPKEESVKVTPEAKRPAIVEVNKISKPLHKSVSLKEPSKPDTIHNSLSLEDARRSLQQSMALLSQAKSESKTLDSPEDERQKQLKTAREIISNAIGDETVGKKTNRLCMGGKPPVPYGSSGRSASGNISLSSLNSLPSSPPISPPHSRVLVRESPVKTFRTEVQHKVDDVRNKYLPNSRGGSVERIIPIQFAETVPKTSSGQLPYQRHNTTPYRFSSLPRGCTPDYDSEQFTQHSVPATPAVNQHSTPSTPSMNRSEPIKKSPREFIIPIAVEGKGYVTPRQGSLEPSETPTKITPPTMGFSSRFSKPRRLSSLVSGGESEDDDDLHMHRLRSSRKIRADPEKESVSSGEEDDDEGFELLTAENLFSTLLDRVRSLTNKLNGEEGTGFPQHSLFNNFHSQFFNSPHLPRKHKRHDIIREGAPWRRSTSRDISSNFDSMFPSHPTFPRGSKKSRKAASSKIHPESLNSQKSSEYESKNKQRQTDDCEINSQESLDLSDLDLSKIELSEKDMETLSGLTPALSRRLQKQLLDHLPPAAARSLRRTLSMNNPINSDDKTPQHKYTRSLSASKTADKQVSISEEENLPINSNRLENSNTTSNQNKPNDFRYHVPYFNDEDTSSISCSSTSNKFDKENNNVYEVPIQNYSSKIVKHNHSSNSLDYINTKSDSSHSESITPRLLSSVRNTPERSVLSKYFSPERTIPCDDYLASYSKSIEMGSLVTEPSYLAAYGGNNSTYTPGGSLKRRSLRTPPADATPRRRVSRFLRPDFFDTPREESIYVRDKKDKESETQKILKEIREKRNRSGASSPISPMVSSDITSLFESASSRISSRNCLSPVSPLTPNRSRSVTPFYPILDNINENQTDCNSNKELQETLISIDKKLDESNSIHTTKKQIENAYNNNVDKVDTECSVDSFKDSKLTRPKSFPSKQNEKLSSYKESVEENKLINTSVNGNISKIARPKSYPATTPSPEKKCIIPLMESQKFNCNNVNKNDISNNNKSNNMLEKQQNIEDDNGNVSVSFSVSLPSKTPKKIENNVTEKIISESTISEKNVSETPIEVPEKKKIIKKKIVIKKKSASAKSVSSSKTADDIPKKSENGVESNNTDASTAVTIKNNEIKSSPKKKSVLQTLGQKFEKLRSEKCSSQERESTVDKVVKTTVNTKDEPKPSRIENVMRVLRERSVPAVNDAESITESGLIKRAVTITNLPTLDDNKEGPKKTVNRVFGLFKKIEPKDKSPKPLPPKQSVISETNNDNTETDILYNKESEKVENVRELSPVNTNVEIKPKRPTSLLLNGIGKRVQACYNGATSDSVLTKTEKNTNNDVSNQNTPKADEAKTQKKGLRLDFSRLPKLNQGIFTKRNSLDLSKSRENSESKEVINPQNNNSDTDKTDANKLPAHQLYEENVSNGMHLASPDANWSPDLDTSKFMISRSEPKETTPHHSHQDNDPTGDSENIIDRIRRKSFYSRFNEKKNRRKSSLVGPGAKEYIPSARINPQCDNDNVHYPNKYDLSPTSPNKYMSSSSLDHSRPSHSSDKSDCLTPTSSRLRNSIGNDPYLSPTSHKMFDRGDQKYSLDSMYPTGLECNTYSIPRYSRTLSYFDDYDSRQGLSEPKSSSSGSSSRYGRTLSLLSPGIYATYSPRSHTRNSAILLRDSADDDVSPDSVLTKIRNRKKAAAQSMQLEDDHHILDTKFRSNHTLDSEHDLPADNTE